MGRRTAPIFGPIARSMFERLIAAIALLASAPILFILAAAIVITSGRPVFYRARRVGRGGGTFVMYKFRTMVASAGGPTLTLAGDPRVTPIGRILRKLKLDELPQLYNVVRGDMQFVGPRPEDPEFAFVYEELAPQLLAVRPGITSPASLEGGEEETLAMESGWKSKYISEILPAKLEIDARYFAQRRLATDIGVVVRTILHMAGHVKRSNR